MLNIRPLDALKNMLFYVSLKSNFEHPTLRGTGEEAYFYPRLQSLRSFSLGLLASVPLRGTTAGHEREA